MSEKNTTFDFSDGQGPVPARQHANPDGSVGGWVAAGVSIAAGVIVGIHARILGGTIRGGTILGGTILGGTILGGTIEGGTILGGTIEGGTILGGTILGGTILGGTIRGGTIWGGTIWGGTILGGTILGGNWKKATLQIQGTRHFVNMCSCTELQIGCIHLTIAKWREKRVVLGEKEGYTPEQIEEYGRYIELAAAMYPPEKEDTQDGLARHDA